jgi:hypothetical protein
VATGEVRLNGQPIPTGAIRFVRTTSDPVTAGAVIRNGRYRTELPEGLYRVEVTARQVVGRETVTAYGVTQDADRTAEAVPERYNTRSELTADVRPGTNRFDFDLTSP